MAKRKGSITPPMRRSGFSTRSDRYLEATARPDHAASCSSRHSVDIIEHHLRGTKFNIHVDPEDGSACPGRGRLSAHLDGRQDGRLGGYAAPRESGRDQRALVQRAQVYSPAGCATAGEDAARDSAMPSMRATRRAIVQPALLERTTAVISTTWSMGRTGERRFRAAESDLRHFARPSRARTRPLGVGPRRSWQGNC